MENVNPPPTNIPPILPTAMRTKVVRELNKLHKISVYIDSRHENIDQLLNGFANQPNEINMDDPEPDNGLVDTPLVSPFLDSDEDLDDEEILNELEEYGNAGKLCQKKVINSFDGDDLAYNTTMVDGLGSTGRNLVAIVKDCHRITNRIACRKFFKKNECEIFTVSGDDVRNFPDGVVPPDLIWMAFGGNIRDLGSIGEETDKTTTLHQSLLKNSVQCLETASQFLAMPSYLTSDGVRTLTTVAEHSPSKETLEDYTTQTMSKTFLRRCCDGLPFFTDIPARDFKGSTASVLMVSPLAVVVLHSASPSVVQLTPVAER
ncbi:hypothetical protein Tco_0033052 [Tanacetum coccineum]